MPGKIEVGISNAGLTTMEVLGGVVQFSGDMAGTSIGVDGPGDSDVFDIQIDANGLVIEADAGSSMHLTIGGQSDGNYTGTMPPAVQGAVNTYTSGLTNDIAGAVASGNMLNTQTTDGIQTRWGEFVAYMNVSVGGALDINALVQQVLRDSYLETTKDLYFYAEKVKYFNEVKKQIREELTDARKHMATHAGKDDEQTVTWTAKGIPGDYMGSGASPEMTDGGNGVEPVNTKADLDAYIQGLEEQLSSVGDDAQLANVDLQNILQKQQQTIQMMSNIAKMLHDTALSVIRKIGG